MKEPKEPAYMVPSKESVNMEQMAAVLHVLRELQPYLIPPDPRRSSFFSPDEGPALPPKLDGGASACAVSTFSKACDRLEKILEDNSRWEMKHNELIESLVETQAHQRAFLAAQTAAASIVSLPSYQLRPSLIIINGEFLAVHGDPAVPGGHIVGKGSTPAEALADFDAAFRRPVAEQFQIESEPAPAPKKKGRKANG